MTDNIINIDSEKAKEFGFTSDKFAPYSYLWEKDDYIYISFIESIQSGKGHLLGLFNKIQEKGFGIRVPTPFPRMSKICEKYGMIYKQEATKPPYPPDEFIELWEKQPPSNNSASKSSEAQRLTNVVKTE